MGRQAFGTFDSVGQCIEYRSCDFTAVQYVNESHLGSCVQFQSSAMGRMQEIFTRMLLSVEGLS